MSDDQVRLVGGEMLLWSDDWPSDTAAGLIFELLRRIAPEAARILVAGPHPRELADRLLSRTGETTFLVRSYPDACDLQRRGARAVYCGAIEKLALPEAFDLIVAVGGLERLQCPDGADLTWAETLNCLTATLAPEGALVICLENELGLHRLAGEPGGVEGDRADAEWLPSGWDRTRPCSQAQLNRRLAETGLGRASGFAAYPSPLMPTVLVADAHTHALPHLPCLDDPNVVNDPRRLTRRARRAGLVATLAPMWIAVARKGADASLSLTLGTDDDCAAYWRVACELEPDDGGTWQRRPAATQLLERGRLVRDTGLLKGALPTGRPLDEILATGCEYGDGRTLREVLGRFTQWLAGHTQTGLLPGELVFADPDNIVCAGDAFAMTDPSWRLAGPVPFGLALARILGRFAVRLTASGRRHPWIAGDELALNLLAMSGLPADPAVVRQAAELDFEVGRLRHDGRPSPEPGRFVEDLPRGHAELASAYRGRSRRMDVAGERIAALEEALATTTRDLADARRDLRATSKGLEALEKSISLFAGRLVTAPVRLPARVLRQVHRRTLGARSSEGWL